MSVSTLCHNLDSAAATFAQHADVWADTMRTDLYQAHVKREDDLTYATNYPVTYAETVESDMTHREWLADEVVIGGECSHPECIVVSTYSREDNSHAGVCLGCGERF